MSFVECPRCGVKKDDLDNYFDDYNDELLFNCDSCGTLFHVERIHITEYRINETCNNDKCKEWMKYSKTCLKSKYEKKGCDDYLPPKELVEQWNKENAEKYEETPIEK